MSKTPRPECRDAASCQDVLAESRRQGRRTSQMRRGGFNNGWNGRSVRLPQPTCWTTHTRLGPFHPLVVRRHGHDNNKGKATAPAGVAQLWTNSATMAFVLVSRTPARSILRQAISSAMEFVEPQASQTTWTL